MLKKTIRMVVAVMIAMVDIFSGVSTGLVLALVSIYYLKKQKSKTIKT